MVVADDAELITTNSRIGVKLNDWTVLFDKAGKGEISVFQIHY